MYRLGANSVVYVVVVDKRTYFFNGFGMFLLNFKLSYNPMEGFSQLHVPVALSPFAKMRMGRRVVPVGDWHRERLTGVAKELELSVP